MDEIEDHDLVCSHQQNDHVCHWTPVPLPSLEKFNQISKTENRWNHSIRVPIYSHMHHEATIIAASPTRVHLLIVQYYGEYEGASASVWAGHPLIPASWKELVPLSLGRWEFVFGCALSSDKRTLCFGFEDSRVYFKCYDIDTGHWTEMCTIDNHLYHPRSYLTIKHTSLGWLALTQTVTKQLQLYKLTQGEAVLLKSLPSCCPGIIRHVLGHNSFYIFHLKIKGRPASLTVYPFESLENPQQLLCQEFFDCFSTSLYEREGQLYKVEFYNASGSMSVYNLSMEGGVCKGNIHFRTMVLLDLDFIESLFDTSNVYMVFCNHDDDRVYLGIQAHQPPSLKSQALLKIQKMFGVKSKFNSNQQEGDDAECDVWEGGITIDEFRDRFGYKMKLF